MFQAPNLHLRARKKKKIYIYESDYPALQQMKFVCAVNVYASDTVAMQLLIDKYLFLNTKQLI